ncbi:hypothetical protein MNBD_NITROSPINAE02-1653 [hydrothermal vent metagenome]|uniref:Response regulatory domain-containing protein n=1 Tax=hydrothermal vent metagenome TaxID=652676 RepID=A0A3B1CPX0_9ZZZZ
MIRVILVSPKAHERRILKDYFARLEYEAFIPGEVIAPEEVDTQLEAIDLMASFSREGEPVHLILCAEKLTDGSGVDLARQIASNLDLDETPVILFSKEMTASLAAEVKEAGVKGVIILPFSMESFRDSLTEMVNESVSIEDAARRVELKYVFETESNMELEERLRYIYSESLSAISDLQLLAPWSLSATLSKAKIYCGQNEFKAALPLLKTIVNHDRMDKMAHELLMLCYKRLGKAYEDTDDLRLLVQQNPWSSALNQRFGEIVMSEGNYDDSIIFFLKAINLYKKSIVAHKGKRKNGQAEPLTQAGNLKEEMTIHSGLVSAYFNLITAYKKAGKGPLVAAALEEVSRISPQTPADWLAMFQTYLSSGDFAKAKYSFNKAIANNPGNQEFIMAAAESYIRQGNYGEALELFEKLARLNASDVRIYNFIGICSRHLFKHLGALNAYKKALAIDPSDASIHFNRGCALEDMNRLDEALTCFNEAARLDPSLMIAGLAINRVENKMHIKEPAQ